MGRRSKKNKKNESEEVKFDDVLEKEEAKEEQELDAESETDNTDKDVVDSQSQDAVVEDNEKIEDEVASDEGYVDTLTEEDLSDSEDGLIDDFDVNEVDDKSLLEEELERVGGNEYLREIAEGEINANDSEQQFEATDGREEPEDSEDDIVEKYFGKDFLNDSDAAEYYADYIPIEERIKMAEELKEKERRKKAEREARKKAKIAREKRVNRIKKLIIAGIIIMFIIPVVMCGILIAMYIKTNKELKSVKKELASIEENITTERVPIIITESPSDVTPTDVTTELVQPEVLEDTTEETTEEPAVSNGKKVYLTFDDGPSERTGEVLKILDEKGVKATFFVIHTPLEQDYHFYNEIVEDGHTLAMHSYTHAYSEVYASMDSYKKDVLDLQDFLKEQTGVSVRYYRFPGGSSNTLSDVPMQDMIKFLDEQNITYFDWNAQNNDASSKKQTADQVLKKALDDIHSNKGDTILLMHDSVSHDETVAALPLLIDQLKSEGYEICPITDETKPIQHVKREEEAD